MIDQAVPFHRSTSVRPAPSPTARQLVVLAHATPVRSSPPGRLGFETAVQRDPFQCSMRLDPSAVFPSETPTAQQLVVLGHAMPDS